MTALACVRDVDARGMAELELVAGPRCRGCAGACLGTQARTVSLRLLASSELRVGDTVTVSLPATNVLHSALLLHGLPWLGLLAGAATAGGLGAGGDLGCLLGAAAGFVAALALATRLGRRLEPATLSRLVVLRGR